MKNESRLIYLLENNEFEILFHELIDNISDENLVAQIHLLSGQYNKLKEEIRIGVIETTLAKTEINKIRFSILEIINFSSNSKKKSINNKEEGYKKLFKILSKHGVAWGIKEMEYDLDWLIQFKSELLAIMDNYGWNFSFKIYRDVQDLLFLLHNLSQENSELANKEVISILERIDGEHEMNDLGLLIELKKEMGIYSKDEVDSAISKRLEFLFKSSKNKKPILPENLEYKGFANVNRTEIKFKRKKKK